MKLVEDAFALVIQTRSLRSKPAKNGVKKSGKRKLCALGFIPVSPIQTSFAQIVLFNGNYLNRNGRMLENRVPADFVSQIFSRIIAYKDLDLVLKSFRSLVQLVHGE